MPCIPRSTLRTTDLLSVDLFARPINLRNVDEPFDFYLQALMRCGRYARITLGLIAILPSLSCLKACNASPLLTRPYSFLPYQSKSSFGQAATPMKPTEILSAAKGYALYQLSVQPNVPMPMEIDVTGREMDFLPNERSAQYISRHTANYREFPF